MQSNKLQLSDMRFKITKMRTMKCQNYILFHKMKLSRYIFTVRLFFLITGSTSPPLALGKRPVSSSRLIRCGLTSDAACLQPSSLLHAWAGDDASPEPPHQWRATPPAQAPQQQQQQQPGVQTAPGLPGGIRVMPQAPAPAPGGASQNWWPSSCECIYEH